MSNSPRSYSAQHAEQVMGLQPGQYNPKAGPTKLMGKQEPISTSGSLSVSEATVPSRPNIPRHMVPTVRPPARVARQAVAG